MAFILFQFVMRMKLGALAAAIMMLSFTSCYTLTYSVGKGSQTGKTVTQKNHYLINGLAALKTANPTEMAGGAADYDVTITHTFVDGLLSVLTSGLYSPTTVTVTK